MEVLFLGRRCQRWRSRLSLDGQYFSGGLHLLVMGMCTSSFAPASSQRFLASPLSALAQKKRRRFRLSLDCGLDGLLRSHLSGKSLKYLCNFLQVGAKLADNAVLGLYNKPRAVLSTKLADKTFDSGSPSVAVWDDVYFPIKSSLRLVQVDVTVLFVWD